jgi:hypothetical protein
MRTIFKPHSPLVDTCFFLVTHTLITGILTIADIVPGRAAWSAWWVVGYVIIAWHYWRLKRTRRSDDDA